MSGALCPTGLTLWERCPRRFFFTHVARESEEAPIAYGALLGVAAHAGLKVLLLEPDAARGRVREALWNAFEAEGRRAQERGRFHVEPDVDRALDRLEGEVLDLVLRLGNDERVRAIDWTHTDARVDWEQDGRLLGCRLDAAGVAREQLLVAADGEQVVIEPGTRLLVDWKFGKRVDTSRLGLALNVQAAFYGLAGARLFPGESTRQLVVAARELLARRPSNARGRPLARTLRELNPAYLAALVPGAPVTESIRAEAQASRRRFTGIPKYVDRPNPAYAEQEGRPRGSAFHVARTAWPVVRTRLDAAVLELEIARRAGEESAFAARGAATGACHQCPFRRRCSAFAARD